MPRVSDKLENFDAELGNARALEMDISQESSVVKAFNELEKADEKIHICVNSAAIILKNTPIFENDSESAFQHNMNINVIGVWQCNQGCGQPYEKS